MLCTKPSFLPSRVSRRRPLILQFIDLLADHLAQGTMLHHDTHDLIKHIRSSHGGVLSICIICGLFASLSAPTAGSARKGKKTYSNLDNVGRDKVQVLQPADDGPKLPSRPTSRLGSARRRGKGRVQGIDVNRQVNGSLSADPVDDSLDDTVGANGVDLACLDNLEAAVAVIVVIARSAESCTDTGVDVGVVSE